MKRTLTALASTTALALALASTASGASSVTGDRAWNALNDDANGGSYTWVETTIASDGTLQYLCYIACGEYGE